jgi:hypothetical protein
LLVSQTANVLAALPKSAHPGAKKALAEIWNAEDRRHALDAVTAFDATYGAKFPKAVAKISDDVDELLAFYDYPAEHWIHLRTTNPIESTFAAVRHRTKVTKGPGSRAAGLRSDGVQAHRVRPGPLARGERTSPRRAHPRWRAIRGRQAGRPNPPGRGMIFDLRPPDTVGPLRVDAPGVDAYRVLQAWGTPMVLCHTGGRRSGWGLERPSGLFVATYINAEDRVEVIELGRPTDSGDLVTYDGINIFAMPAEKLLDVLRARTTIVEIDEEDGSTFLAPDLHLMLWRPPAPATPDDIDNRFIVTIRVIKSIETDQIKPAS